MSWLVSRCTSRLDVVRQQFICPQCGKGEATKGNLKRHQNSHRERATMPCHICQKLISSSTLKVHMKIHKDEKPYACSHCDATFKSSQALKRHTGIHTGNKTSFSCLKCEKNLLGHGALKSHMMLHTGEKPRACSYCPYQSVQAVSLQCHIQNNHIREKTFHCTICDDYFFNKNHMRKHYTLINENEGIPCKKCNKTFLNVPKLNQHIRNVHA